MSIENSIDRLAAAIESLANAVAAPVVVVTDPQVNIKGVSDLKVDVADGQVHISPSGQPAEVEVKKSRGRPRKAAADAAAPTQTEGLVAQGAATVTVEDCALRPTSAAADPAVETATTSEESAAPAKEQASASTATVAAGSTQSQISAPVTAESNLTKADIVQILTGLQKKLEETAKSIDEKRAAAQKCRDLIKSVVGSESLKDAKPEHFGRIKSAVLKVLNND